MITLVDRTTSCIVAWAVSAERSLDLLQSLVDQAPPARFYYSDLFAVWRAVLYLTGLHTPMPDKSETFRVEGDNAELRHYLARLARSSRCFSRSLKALGQAIPIDLFCHSPCANFLTGNRGAL